MPLRDGLEYLIKRHYAAMACGLKALANSVQLEAQVKKASTEDPDPRTVGVFRLQLFKPSETFIPAQVRKYQRYKAIYLGSSLHGPPPDDAVVITPRNRWGAALRLFVLGDAGPFVAALGDRRLDLIHAHFAVDAAFAAPLARRLGVPLIVTLHGFDVTLTDRALLGRPRPALIAARLRRRLLQRSADAFVCVSDFIRRAALRQGYPDARLKVLRLGIDIASFLPHGRTDPNLIVHVGRMVEKKGTSFLLQAFSRLSKEFPECRLEVIGDGPLLDALRQEAVALELERVTFAGALPHGEVIKRMSRAAAIAVPSVTARDGDSEGLPTVIFEAAALGRAVVASDTSGIPEAIQHERTGLLVAERDVDGLAVALGNIIREPELSAQMGRAARRMAEVEFDSAVLTRQLEELYDAQIGRHRWPSQG